MLEPATKPIPPAAESARHAGAHAAALRLGSFLPRNAFGLDAARPELFAEAIERFRRHHGALADPAGSGGLLVLDLGEIRRRFVNRWPVVEAKALQIVEGILARRLGAHDRYVAAGGDRFLLLLTDVDRMTAERQAQRIAAEITERLCGRTPGGVAARIRRTALDLVAGLADVDGLTTLERRLAEREAAAAPAAADPALAVAGLGVRWTPILDLAKRLVAAYALELVRPGPHGPLPPAPSDGDVGLAAEVDHLAVAAAAEPLSAGRTLLVVPLHYASLASMRHREPLLIACRKLPRSASRRLVVELCRLPPGLPQARLHELVRYIRPLVAGIVLRLEAATLDPAAERTLATQLVGTGIKGVSIDLAEAPADAGSVAMLVDIAGRLGLRSLVHAGSDRQVCREAFAAGAAYLGSTALLPSTTMPSRAIVLRAD